MRRRDFLITTAASSVLASAMRPTAVTAQEQAPVRCGLYGLGHSHAFDALKVLRASEDYEVVGYCEPDEAMHDRYGGAEALQGLNRISEAELLEDESVHMLAVESNVPRLLEFAEKTIAAGKHLHLDKPAGTSLPRFKKILDEAEQKDLLVQMGYMFRYNPGFDLIRQAVREGWLGRIYSIDACMSTDLSAEKRLGFAHHPGGAMLELGCHLIDMIVLLLGRPAKVTPFLRHDSPTEDALSDNTLAVLEYDHAMVQVESTAQEFQPFPERRFKIVGSEGSIILSPLEPPSVRVALREAHGDFPKGVTHRDLPDLDRHVLDFEDLAACIRGERAFAYSKAHDFTVQETVLRACGVEA